MSNIGNIVYRDKTSEIMTTRQNNFFSDLSADYFPDYSDYFLQKKGIELLWILCYSYRKKSRLPLEQM